MTKSEEILQKKGNNIDVMWNYAYFIKHKQESKLIRGLGEIIFNHRELTLEAEPAPSDFFYLI